MGPLDSTDPTVIASYRLLGVLGGGGMGRVYLGSSPSGRRVAIKVIRPELAEELIFRQRFAREVTAARAVNPLFTAPVIDADAHAPAPWLATAYIDGPSLDSRIRRYGPLSIEAALTLATGLAEALVSIHRAGLVHRDLKPGNILLDDEGPHVIDFGIALSIDSSRLTTSVAVGTPSYMAPERILGEDDDASGDIFSLGACLYFAVTGRMLVSEGSMFEQISQLTQGRFDLSVVPGRLRPIIVLCISLRQQDRPTAHELARILIGLGAATPVPGWFGGRGPADDRAGTSGSASPPGVRMEWPTQVRSRGGADHTVAEPGIAVGRGTAPVRRRRLGSLVGGVGAALTAAVHAAIRTARDD